MGFLLWLGSDPRPQPLRVTLVEHLQAILEVREGLQLVTYGKIVRYLEWKNVYLYSMVLYLFIHMKANHT